MTGYFKNADGYIKSITKWHCLFWFTCMLCFVDVDTYYGLQSNCLIHAMRSINVKKQKADLSNLSFGELRLRQWKFY